MSRFKDWETRCRVCGVKRANHQHHVVYKQEVRRSAGDINDPHNAFAICTGCHTKHHGANGPKIQLTLLRDENYQFAASLMGSGRAYEYLRRRYDGDDPRLDALLN